MLHSSTKKMCHPKDVSPCVSGEPGGYPPPPELQRPSPLSEGRMISR